MSDTEKHDTSSHSGTDTSRDEYEDEELIPSYKSRLPEGRRLRMRSNRELAEESGDDYAEFLHNLQIKPEMYNRFLTGVLRVVRRKHTIELRTGSEASIRNLSSILLRGFGGIIWRRNTEEWLVEQPTEPRLTYNRLGQHDRFYPLLHPVWQKMRDICFEEKSQPKARVSAESKQESVHASVTDRDQAYQADSDTEHTTPGAVNKVVLRTQQQFEQLVQNARSPPPTERSYLSVSQTEKGLADVVERLHNVRSHSKPAIFDRLWEQQMGRLEELAGLGWERMEDDKTTETAEPAREAAQTVNLADRTWSNPQATKPISLNLANEPFSSRGLPLPAVFPRPLPPQLPRMMTVYITTAPPTAIYTNQSYCWTDAPISLVDQQYFFEGVNARVDTHDDRITGYAMSYGWNDLCRWVSNDVEGRRHGWTVFQRDLTCAADRMVRTFRCKVLVVGRRM